MSAECVLDPQSRNTLRSQLFSWNGFWVRVSGGLSAMVKGMVVGAWFPVFFRARGGVEEGRQGGVMCGLCGEVWIVLRTAFNVL